MVQNGVIETATGDLLRCGFATFTAGAGETLRADVPCPGYYRGCRVLTDMHRWNGAAWITLAQPPETLVDEITDAETMRSVMDADGSSDQSVGNEHKWELWDGHPDDGGVVAFKVSLVNNVVTLSTPMAGGISFGDVQVNSLGVGVVPSGGTGQIDTTSVIRATGGSAAVPSFSFTNDIDTGVYRVTADQIGFATSGVLRVRIDNSNLRLYVGQVWNSDNTNDMGASGALRPRTAFLGTALNVGSPVVSTGVGHIRAGDGTRLLKWDAATGGLDLTGAGASLGVGVAASGVSGAITAGNGTITLSWNPTTGLWSITEATSTLSWDATTGRLLVESDSSADIFGVLISDTWSGGPRSWLITPNYNAGGLSIRDQTAGAVRWWIHSSGHFRAGVDNVHDHGASGASRPRTGYFGTSLNVGDGVTVTTVNGSINAGDGTRIFKWNAAAATASIDGATHGIEIVGETLNLARICVGANSADTTGRLYFARRGGYNVNMHRFHVYANEQLRSGPTTTAGTKWYRWTCGGMTDRVYIQDNGPQVWILNSGAGEVGRIVYATPAGVPGIAFFNAAVTERSDWAHLQGGSGGFKWSAHGTGGGPPASAELLRLDGAAGAIFNQSGNAAFDLLAKGDTADVLFVDAGAERLEARAQFALTGDISDSLAVQQDDYNPTGLATASIIKVSLTANVTVTGLAGGADGRIVIIENLDTVLTLTLNHQDASSAAANRFILPGGINKAIAFGQAALCVYDSGVSRWRAYTLA